MDLISKICYFHKYFIYYINFQNPYKNKSEFISNAIAENQNMVFNIIKTMNVHVCYLSHFWGLVSISGLPCYQKFYASKCEPSLFSIKSFVTLFAFTRLSVCKSVHLFAFLCSLK